MGSPLPPKVAEALEAFMKQGKTGCWELHFHEGELKVVKQPPEPLRWKD